MELFNYLLKVSACTALFFAFYLLVLRRLTFFKINRFYLLFTLLLSFVIPTLHFTIEREVEAAPAIDMPVVTQNESTIEQIDFAPIINTAPSILMEEPFDWLSLLPYLYVSVVCSLLALATWRLFKLIKHAKRNTQEINGLKLVPKSEGFTNCSFFSYVFIDENNLTENELQVLLRHEEVHVKQYHSVDKILLIIAKAVLWFNPIIYLYDKALEQIHEYEADETTSQNFGTATYANLLLRLAVTKTDMPLVHNFVKSPIKERIKMLYHSKSKQMKKLMYLLALPIGLGLLWGFTVKVVEVLPKTKTKTEKEFTLILDAGHGGKQIGTEVNGYKEKDIALAFANRIKALAEAKGIKVITTRNGDKLVSLKDRAEFTGDILLPLHANSEPVNNGGKRNGIEMYSSNRNESLKATKVNALSSYLFEGMQNLEGITVNPELKSNNVFLLRESKVPGLILELGYLTNKSDLKFITNEAKQNELAAAIVNGIMLYKENATKDAKIEINDASMGYSLEKNQQNIPFIDRKTVSSTTGKKNENIKVIVKNKTVANITTSEIGVAKLFFLINEKVYTEAEAMKFTPSFIAQLSVKNGVGNLETAYDMPNIAKSISNFVIWFGKEPKLADYALKNKAYYEKYNGKTVEGKVIGFTYSNAKVMDGFLVKTNNGETLKANVEAKFAKQTAKMVTKNDNVAIKIYNAKYWKDSEYPVLISYKISKGGKLLYDKWPKVEFKNSIIVDKVGVNAKPAKPELISSSSVRVDSKMEVSYVKNGTMKIYGGLLEAKEITFDQKNERVVANNGSLKNKNGDVINGEVFNFDLKKGTIEIKKSSGNVNSSKITINGVDFEACRLEKVHFSSLAANAVPHNDLLSKFNLKARDSVVNSKYMITLYGNAILKFGAVVLSGDKIEVQKDSYNVLAYNAELSGVDKNPIKAKSISYNPIYKKIQAIGVLKHNGYWDRTIN